MPAIKVTVRAPARPLTVLERVRETLATASNDEVEAHLRSLHERARKRVTGVDEELRAWMQALGELTALASSEREAGRVH